MGFENKKLIYFTSFAGILYNGNGILVGKPVAAMMYKQAANLGHDESMYKYGVMLYDGDGIQMGKKEAV